MQMKQEIKRLGNIYGFSGGSYAGNVYSQDGMCPALNSATGGNRQPMIVVRKLQSTIVVVGNYHESNSE